MRTKEWKRALTSFNVEETFHSFAVAECYILGLKLENGESESTRTDPLDSACLNLYITDEDRSTLKYICRVSPPGSLSPLPRGSP